MKKKNKLRPFGTWDGCVCVTYAYAYMIGFTTLNFLLLIITELCWVWWCTKRVKEYDE